MILFKIIRNLICKASAFFFSKLCPFCAPFRRAFINIWALKARVMTIFGHSHIFQLIIIRKLFILKRPISLLIKI